MSWMTCQAGIKYLIYQGMLFQVFSDGLCIDTVLPYAEVKDVTRSGLSRRAKAILIPTAIGGGVLLVLCAGPYPIGFLCRKDPS